MCSASDQPTTRRECCYFTLGHCRGRYDVQDLGVDDTGRVDLGPWETPEFLTVLRRCVRRVVDTPERTGA
ncbi:hypothetical protein [Streptomyces sp. NPDC050121]|uniref:hypothetical protein n=1 Tax=Streptomyces sp. NPDC050121 TaxID=3365601 RepID=UPI00378D97D5